VERLLAYAELFLMGAGWVVSAYLHRGLHKERLCPVTALVTRHAFVKQARRMISRADAVVIFIDFDKFKRVNDRYGHEGGDTALRVLADRLREHFGPTALVGRLSGDEFAVVAFIPAGEIEPTLAKLRERVAAPINLPRKGLAAALGLPTKALRITLSVGAVHVGALRRPSLSPVLNRADALMYGAKRAGRNRARIYIATGSELELMTELKRQIRGWPRAGLGDGVWARQEPARRSSWRAA
jgi:diguanylate cyclase (GGDEF)-like protein